MMGASSSKQYIVNIIQPFFYIDSHQFTRIMFTWNFNLGESKFSIQVK